MTKHGRSKDPKRKTNADQKKPNTDGHSLVDHTTKLEDKKSTTLHDGNTSTEQQPPTATEFVNAVYHWLLHWWDAPREKSKAADWAIAALTIGIAIAAFWSAFIFQAQLEEARRQTEISERPWLSVEAAPVNGLLFVNGEQAVLKLKLSIKNVGKSIAKGVQADAKLFPAPAGMPVAVDAAEKQRELCDHPKTDSVGSFDLFPADHPVDREMDISAIPSSIIAQSVTTGDKSRRFVGFYVVGCVSYHSSFGATIHQTRFAYHLIRSPITSPDGKFITLPNGTPLMMDFEVGVNVPQGEMGMMQELFSRNDAN